jgi:hypothetical protein
MVARLAPGNISPVSLQTLFSFRGPRIADATIASSSSPAIFHVELLNSNESLEGWGSPLCHRSYYGNMTAPDSPGLGEALRKC